MIFADEEPRQMLRTVIKLKDQLSDLIEPDFGLLHELLSVEVLSRRQCATIRRGDKTAYDQNDVVLDLLTSDDQCEKLLTALQRTGQQHVVNFITQNGGQ